MRPGKEGMDVSGRKRRGFSFGSVIMLLFTAAVLGGSAFVLLRLSSGHSVDLSRLNTQIISMTGDNASAQDAEGSESRRETATAKPAQGQNRPSPTPELPRERQTVLTFGGTIAVEENIRKSGYASDSKKYDFTDFFTLLKPEIQGSCSGVFLENLVMENEKVSSTVIPEPGAEMIRSAGFSLCFTGFGKAWDKAENGIRTTLQTLQKYGITPLGLCAQEIEKRYIIRESDGIRIAYMQYTDTVAPNTRKTMRKRQADFMIPNAEPDLISADIAAARSDGAQAVIVLLNWGKAGEKNPDKAQMLLAQQIADSGADLIIGAGSRMPQRVEKLIASDGRQVLCAYSLGTLISDSRKSSGRMSGFLLHVHLTLDPDQHLSIGDMTYTPTYIWKYRQDSRIITGCWLQTGLLRTEWTAIRSNRCRKR